MNLLDALRTRLHREMEASAERSAAIEAIMSEDQFVKGLSDLAEQAGRDQADVVAAAAGYLDEIVTVQSPALPDFNLVLARISDRRGFEGVLEYDDAILDRLKALNVESPLVMLTAHRSYQDFIVRVPFSRRGFEREYRFAGANINFWPMGRIAHSAGIIFVRRGFRDPVYSFALRYYVTWLAERRSNFLWAIEGGRTRTGKLLHPKAGLMAYVAGAYVSGRAPDVILVPATTIYEYLDETFEYARYGRGGAKSSENILHTVRLTRAQRNVPAQAKVYIGIGEPVSLAQFIERDSDDDQLSAGITEALIEVSRRIDAATPITSVALVLLPLLEAGGVELTVDELVDALAPTVSDIARRGLPAPEAGIGEQASVVRALDLLRTQGLVSTSGTGSATRYRVTDGRHIEAAYYRNAIVHFFAIGSMIEIALVRAATADDGARVDAFWAAIDELRELLDQEFFFPAGDGFEAAVGEELAAHDDAWQTTLASPGGSEALLARVPQQAGRALAPFVEAYKIVADGLRRLGDRQVGNDSQFRRECLARAELDLSIGRLRCPDAASLNMFDIPLKLAARRHLVDAPVEAGRDALCAQIDAAIAAIRVRQTAASGTHAAGPHDPGDVVVVAG